MLIILPPSEAKRPAPDSGKPVSLDALSFPQLNPMRERIVDALIETSSRPDALERLLVGPSLVGEVVRNTDLRDEPTRPAIEVYTGPLYQGLDAGSMSEETRSRANVDVVIASSLWGALRPGDPIPAYRLHVCARLVGLERLEPMWRTVLPRVLADAAGERGAVIDLRSAAYQAIGKPHGVGERTASLKVEQRTTGGRMGDVVAKRIRGEAARQLLDSGADPDSPAAVADILAERWPVQLREPASAGGAWTLRLHPID